MTYGTIHPDIVPISPSEYEEVVAVWKAAVRATHHFLEEKDIQYFHTSPINIDK